MKRLALLLLFAVPSFAAKHSPLPPEAYSAKTIFIDNQTGIQQAMDEASDDLTKWGRFAIVTDASKADIVVSLATFDSLYQGTTVVSVRMKVMLRNSTSPFFQDEELARGFHLENNRIGLSARKCLDKFRKRLQEKT